MDYKQEMNNMPTCYRIGSLYIERINDGIEFTIISEPKTLHTVLYADELIDLIKTITPTITDYCDRMIKNHQHYTKRAQKEIQQYEERLQQKNLQQWDIEYINKNLPIAQQEIERHTTTIKKYEQLKQTLQKLTETIEQIR